MLMSSWDALELVGHGDGVGDIAPTREDSDLQNIFRRLRQVPSTGLRFESYQGGGVELGEYPGFSLKTAQRLFGFSLQGGASDRDRPYNM
jgi:hypothetical protein